MRQLVRSAVQTSKAVERKARNAESESRKKNAAQSHLSKPARSSTGNEPPGQSPPQPSSDTRQRDPEATNAVERPKEFAKVSTSTPRRLNDIAQAPPEIKEFPRAAMKVNTPKREGVLSMAQKSSMDQEREKAIARYRMLKASRQLIAENV
jgi:hypothetical protein